MSKPHEEKSHRIALSRRSFLGASVGALAVAGVGALATAGPARAATPSDFAAIISRRAAMLTGAPANPSEVAKTKISALEARAAQRLATLDTSATRAVLWADQPNVVNDSAQMSECYNRLRDIAYSWATPGTTHHRDAAVATTVVDALTFLGDRCYTSAKSPTGNWWFWEIGIPTRLTDIGSVMFAVLPTEELAKWMAATRRFAPDPNYRGTGKSLKETGANRSDKAVICMLRGALVGSDAEVQLGRDAIIDVTGGGALSLFAYTTKGDGFYPDGSFIQHGKLPYVGTYGNVAMTGMINAQYLLEGLPWALPATAAAMVPAFLRDSFAPYIWNGRMMDTVRGRAVSRERESDLTNGFGTMHKMVLLSGVATGEVGAWYRGTIKGWVTRSGADFLATVPLPLLATAEQLLADGSVAAAPEPVGHVEHHMHERKVHRGEGWAFTVSTSSNRIGRFEWGNRENITGYHHGDGATYLYTDADPGHYTDAYWPTADPFKLAGITVNGEPRVSGASGFGIPGAPNAYNGGASSRGEIGTVGNDFVNHSGKLTAYKSWFMLPDRVVALGAGITDTSGTPAYTVVEHRKSSGELRINGGAVATTPGDRVDAGLLLPGAHAHLEGHAGYLLPDGGALVAERERRTGSWWDVNQGADTAGSTTPHTREYVTLRVPHGVGAAGASYVYAVLPGASAADTARAAENPGFAVVENSATAQVIRLKDGTLMANFFAAGTAGQLRTDGPVSVIVRATGTSRRVALALPTKQATPVRVTFLGQLVPALAPAPGVRVVTAEPLQTLEVTAPQGNTVELDLA
ncbi:polysaccharide lyase family 8 super-sandwich domain-containing protein [Micromonospora sp. LZ34]